MKFNRASDEWFRIAPAADYAAGMQPATLQSLTDLGLVAVDLCCDRCHRRDQLCLIALIGVLGGDYPVPDVRLHCICRGCGEQRRLETRPSWEVKSPGVVTRHIA